MTAELRAVVERELAYVADSGAPGLDVMAGRRIAAAATRILAALASSPEVAALDEACIGDPSHQYHTHDDDPDPVSSPEVAEEGLREAIDAVADALNAWDQGESPRPDTHRHWLKIVAALTASDPVGLDVVDAARLERVLWDFGYDVPPDIGKRIAAAYLAANEGDGK